MSMEDNAGKFAFSDDDCHWTAEDFYNTRQDAIEAGTEYYDLAPGDSLYTGIVYPIMMPKINACVLLNDMRDQISCEIEDYDADIIDASKEDVAELGAMLNKTFDAWVKSHKISTQAFTVEKVETHVIPGKDVK